MDKPEIDKSVFYRAIADFYEQHPELPFGDMWIWEPSFRIRLDKERAKEQLRAIGSFDKIYEGDSFVAVKEIGGVKVKCWMDRDAVCERVVTGTRHVEAELVPEYVTPARLIEAHEEEIVEWKCPESILAPTPGSEPKVAAEFDDGSPIPEPEVAQ